MTAAHLRTGLHLIYRVAPLVRLACTERSGCACFESVVGLRRHVKGHTLLSWRNYISFAGNPAFAAVHLPPEHQHGSQYDERPDSCKWLAGKRPIAFNRDNADKISSSIQR